MTDSIDAVPTGIVNDRRDAIYGVRQFNYRTSQTTTKKGKAMAGILRFTLFTSAIVGLILTGSLAILRMEPSTVYLPIARSFKQIPLTGEFETNIDLIKPNGDVVYRIYQGLNSRYVAAVSPDGQWIYVQENYNQLLRIRADLSVEEVLSPPTDFVSFGRFSPDAEWIIFRSKINNNFDLYRMRLDGTDVQRLTHSPLEDFCERWTPDSDWIIYVNRTSSPGYAESEVYRMRPDGSQQLNLSNHTGIDEFGAVSGDGQWVIFWSNREGNGEIFRVRIDGTGMQNLTRHPGADGLEFLSPDGQWIYFSSERTGTQHLYRMQIDGRGLQRLTNLAHTEYLASMSPDGQWIVFHAGGVMYKMTADGSHLTPVWQNIPTYYNGMYSPDSRSYYFRANTVPGIWSLLRLDLEDNRVHHLSYPGEVLAFLNLKGLPWQSAYPLIGWSATLLTACAWLIRRQRNA